MEEFVKLSEDASLADISKMPSSHSRECERQTVHDHEDKILKECSSYAQANYKVLPTESRAGLQQSTSHLIEEINDNRQQNSQMLDEYKKCQFAMVERVCVRVESSLLATINRKEPEVEMKLQQLLGALSRIERLEEELEEFRTLLDTMCKTQLT